jgi:general secretion pathway protein H
MMNRRRSVLRSGTLHRGFTLIEIMVVVVIAGIISSIVIMSMGVLGDDRNLQREVYRMGSLVELAADEATLQGRDFGLEFLLTGYRFVEHDPYTNQWAEVIGDEILRPRQLPEDFEIEVFIEDRRIQLDEQAADTESDDDQDRNGLENYAPHVMLMSSGDLSPFDLTMTRLTDDAWFRLSVLPNGEVRIGKEDEDFE